MTYENERPSQSFWGTVYSHVIWIVPPFVLLDLVYLGRCNPEPSTSLVVPMTLTLYLWFCIVARLAILIASFKLVPSSCLFVRLDARAEQSDSSSATRQIKQRHTAGFNTHLKFSITQKLLSPEEQLRMGRPLSLFSAKLFTKKFLVENFGQQNLLSNFAWLIFLFFSLTCQ